MLGRYPDPLRRTSLRILLVLVFGLICAAFAADGLGVSAWAGLAVAAVGLATNLWGALRPGEIVLTEHGLQARRMFWSADLDWPEVGQIEIGRFYQSRFGFMFLPWTGASWVEVRRRDGEAPLKLYGAGTSAEALRLAILEARSDWQARRRAVFDA